MFYQAKQYIKFLLKSTNQHGVHSPFVYDLVTKCFYDRSSYDAYKAIKNYKKNLLHDKGSINVTDLGAGSQVMKQEERLVRQMAKNAGSTLKRAKLLYRFSAYFKPLNILELGTSLGIATQALSLGHPEAKITTIEGCPNISAFSKALFKDENLNNIESLQGDFSTKIEKLTSHSYDLIFFDGNHQKDATLEYFESLLQTASNDSVFIFDDIYWSEAMTEAWEIIKKHPKVTVTIDTFFWGFVFFRKEQVKEDFVVRC
ncbi:class I SAM-dependent methyltransferase [Tamlana haliotis]|uniref:Class I SAM-dependent methyltransferase n=1 Tax=Pseudotamlana haliotis TaxID=2614804 RepID=A0A6N6M508_9FLAO|nr:class I SAM-dependent methyltransferase [Tamlana haliotis]KAB1064561.1 class I SAM-dependent methyltransferase [Tamlana haliotis]